MVSHRERMARYGLTPEDYLEMLYAGNGGCWICGKPPEENQRLAVDHDHRTSVVRGLLCGPCNVGVGMFGDNPERMERAAQYVRDNSCAP